MPAPRYVRATYTPAALPEFSGNPLIEALPPTLSRREALKRLLHPRPVCTPRERAMDPVYRMKAVRRIRSLFTVLPVHDDLYQRISSMIEWGYQPRNPMLPGVTGSLQQRIEELEEAVRAGTLSELQSVPAQGFTIVGVSGVGKSTAIRRILSNYSQVISHSNYNGRHFLVPQIVYLHLECPANRTLKSLCQSFIKTVDELLVEQNYYEKYGCKRASTEWLSIVMATIARNHHLGVIVLDEVQNLRTQNGSDGVILNFLVELSNKLNVPILLIGTPDAADVLAQFRLVRRGTGEGDLTWDRLSPISPEWDLLVRDLWRYQFTTNTAEMTDELVSALYDESQGITDLAVKAFALTQIRAILDGSEIISVELLRRTAREAFSMCQEALLALRAGEEGALRRFSDVSLRKVFDAAFFDKHWKAGLAAAQRQESLELITEYRSSLSDTDDQVTEIAAWLTECGIENEVALQAAEKAVRQSRPDADPRDLRRTAYQLCSDNQEEQTGKRGPGRSESKKRKRPQNDGLGLVDVVNTASQDGKSPYEALKEAGLTLSKVGDS